MKELKEYIITELLDGNNKLLKPIEVKQFIKICLNNIIVNKDKDLARELIFDISKFNIVRKKIEGINEIYNYYATLDIRSNKDFYFDCRIDAEKEGFITVIYTFYNVENSNNSLAMFATEITNQEFLNSLKIKRSPKIDYMLTVGKGPWSEHQGLQAYEYFQNIVIKSLSK